MEGFGFTNPELTEEEKRRLFEIAAYWEIKAEDAERALNYARRQRRLALLALGMVNGTLEAETSDS